MTPFSICDHCGLQLFQCTHPSKYEMCLAMWKLRNENRELREAVGRMQGLLNLQEKIGTKDE